MPTVVTRTVKPSGGDYTSLASFEAGEQRDLVALDEIARAECYAFEDTGGVTFDSWTTDETRRIVVEVPLAERGTTGRWADDGYRLTVPSGLYAIAMTSLTTHVVEMIGVKIENKDNSGSSFTGTGVRLTSNSLLILDSCIFRRDPALPRNTARGIWLHATDGRIRARNTITSGYNIGIHLNQGSNVGHHRLYNVSSIDCDTGYTLTCRGATSTLRVKNSRAALCGTDWSMSTIGIGTEEYVTNLSEDTTAPGADAIHSATVAFVDAANEDYHLAAGDAGIGAGTDLSADAFWPFTTDIDGDTRSAWDIGADELAAPAGLLTPALVLTENPPGQVEIDNTNLPDPNATDWEIERDGEVIAVIVAWPYTDDPSDGVEHTYRARARRAV